MLEKHVYSNPKTRIPTTSLSRSALIQINFDGKWMWELCAYHRCMCVNDESIYAHFFGTVHSGPLWTLTLSKQGKKCQPTFGLLKSTSPAWKIMQQVLSCLGKHVSSNTLHAAGWPVRQQQQSSKGHFFKNQSFGMIQNLKAGYPSTETTRHFEHMFECAKKQVGTTRLTC